MQYVSLSGEPRNALHSPSYYCDDMIAKAMIIVYERYYYHASLHSICAIARVDGAPGNCSCTLSCRRSTQGMSSMNTSSYPLIMTRWHGHNLRGLFLRAALSELHCKVEASAGAMAADRKTTYCNSTNKVREFQHQKDTFGSLHDSDHDGIVRT